MSKGMDNFGIAWAVIRPNKFACKRKVYFEIFTKLFQQILNYRVAIILLERGIFSMITWSLLQFLLRYSSTIQYTFNNFQWQKKCPNIPFVVRWGKNLFKNPVYSVSHAPWCPVCSFSTSSDITFSSFHGWKSVLCMHVCPGEFQEIYVGSKPKGICSDG